MTAFTAPPRVVCFDLGGVLVRIRRTFRDATLAADLPLREHPELKSEAWQKRRGQLIFDHQVGRLTFNEYTQALSLAIDGLYTPEEVGLIHHAVTELEYPGVLSLVDELGQLPGIVTACLSNTNDAHWERLDDPRPTAEYPSVSRLHIRLASHLLGVAKPDPAIYAAATERFACAPLEVAFFDDLEKNVEAARAAGWRAALVDHAGDPARQMRETLIGWGVRLEPPEPLALAPPWS